MTDSEVYQIASEVNGFWNRAIRQVNEPPGQDYWQLPSETVYWGTGDCEDIAIAKMFTIRTILWDEPMIPIHLLTINHKHEGAHVVLLVGTWVLDNLLETPMNVNEYKHYVESVRFISSVEVPDDPRFIDLLARMNDSEFAQAITAYNRRAPQPLDN